ncbi:TPA: toxin-coregulated pilus assembly protein TcpE, partial [Vibrio cholerae O1]|nr:toxin-coregulated pilus assembly protein TcpE [Vibrio cholerae O1]HBN6864778.1 toxin-coregulated pilus assembly protein TcpE [Vibrio cholerae]
MKIISKKYRLELYSMLVDLLNDNIPLYDALNKIQNEGVGIYDKNFIKSIELIKDRMKSNSSLTDALTGLIPDKEVLMINVAENSGKISSGIAAIRKNIIDADEIKSKAISSMITPSVMLIVTMVVIAGYSVKVFPTFESVLPVSRWPGVTQALYNLGFSLYEGLWIKVLIFVAIFITILVFMSKNITGNFRDGFLDKLPPFNFVKHIAATEFLANMSMLLDSRVPFKEGLDIVDHKTTRWLSSHLQRMKANMQEGLDYKQALDTNLLDKKMLLTMAVYSELPNFSDVMQKLAIEANINLHKKIATLAGVMKNISLITLALSVIWIFGAIFSLVDK